VRLFLLTGNLSQVSGVPPLERAGDKKFGDDPKYQAYKRHVAGYCFRDLYFDAPHSSVPVFWPWGSTK